MTKRCEKILPDHVRREFEQTGKGLSDWYLITHDNDKSNHVELFHLIGVNELLCEAKDTLITCDVVLSNPDAIPIEQPANVKHVTSTPLDSIEPSIMSQFIDLDETWGQARIRMRQQVKRMAFGYALMKFFAAMPNPEGRGLKWSRGLTRRWQDTSEHLVPVYMRYKEIRNTHESHRGKAEDKGGQVVSYHITLDDDEFAQYNDTSPDPDLHFDPKPEDVVALRTLIGDALSFVRLQADGHATIASFLWLHDTLAWE